MNPLSRTILCRVFADVLLIFVLYGCAGAPASIRVDFHESIPVRTFAFSDERTEASKNGDHGDRIVSYGDRQLDPPPAMLIEQTLRRANQSLEGKQVVLKSFFLTYSQTPVQHGAMSSSAYVPPGQAFLASMFDSSRTPDYCTAGAEITVDGVPVKVFTGGEVYKLDGDSAVRRVLVQALDRLVDAVRAMSTSTTAGQAGPDSGGASK